MEAKQYKINELKAMVVKQATIVEKMIEKAMAGLSERNKAKLEEVLKVDEPEVNRNDVLIEAACISFMALYSPEAKDLRFTVNMIKINVDLERMGDAAVNIAESAVYLIERPEITTLERLPKMAEVVRKMVHDAIEAFITEDKTLAHDVCDRDDIVDQYNKQIAQGLTAHMVTEPPSIERAMNLVRIARNFERIADHATNIAEDVIYIASGDDIKHRLLGEERGH